MKKAISIILVFSMIAGLGTAANHSTSHAAAIKISKSKLSLTVGKSYTLKIKGTSKKVKWTSSKKSVATVGSSTGKVKAKKAGTSTITAKVSGKKYRCRVTVKSSTVKATGTTGTGTKANPLSGYDKFTFNYYEEGKKKGKFRIQLLLFTSGDEAAQMAANNSTNPVPEENQEYLYFKFQIHYLSGDQTINARDVFNYYYNIYGENSTVQMKNLDWGFFFEPVDDLGTTELQPGNNITCSKAVLVNKGYGPITYKIQTGKNSYTWFTTEQ
jgi:hypothetical protein